MTRGKRRLVAVAAAVVLLAAGCGDDDDDVDSAADETTTTAAEGSETEASEAEASETEGSEGGAGEALEVTAVDYEFQGAPDEVQAGLVELTFTNDGAVAHEFAVAELGDTDIEAFVTEFSPALEGGPFPEYVQNVAVPATVEAGGSVETSFLLAEGEYALFCTLDGKAPEAGETTTTAAPDGPPPEEESGPAHHTIGMIQPLSVTAGDAGELPEADGSIVARDYDFEVDVQAGEQTVTFVNEGPDQVHHAVLFPFAEGVDEAQAESVLEAFLSSTDEEAPPPPELDFAAAEGKLNDTGIFSAGLGQTITENFESGRTYAAVCFIQDRSGGPPHVVAHGMKEVFTVE